MDAQEDVAKFIEQHDLQCKPEYRILDLYSEMGELAKNACVSTNYGTTPNSLDIKEDEFGDVLFSLLAVANHLKIDADKALEEALTKYESRIQDTDSPSSSS
ncbi:MAG: MazG nucleotide pyrophosphohydrolase domain-containing protein [Halobacteriaceae archaeon]